MTHLPYRRLSFYYLAYFAFVGGFVPYWGLYLESISFTAVQIGVLMSVTQFTRMVTPNALGWLADHSGRRIFWVRLSGFVACLSFLAVFFTKSFEGLFWVMLLLSIFWTGPLPLVEATTLAHLGREVKRYSLIRAWGSVGFIGAVVGLGYMLDWIAVAWLPHLLLGLLMGVFLAAMLVPEARPGHGAADKVPLRSIVARPEVLAFFLSVFFMAAAHGPYYTFYSIDLVAHGYSKSLVGWLWALGVVAEIGVFLATPRLLARFSVWSMLAASAFLAVVRFLAIGWGVESLTVLLLAQILHAATFGVHHAAAIALVHRLFSTGHAAKGQALYSSLSFGAGGTVGGLYAGAVWEAWGPVACFSAGAACAAGALACLIYARRRAAEGSVPLSF